MKKGMHPLFSKKVFERALADCLTFAGYGPFGLVAPFFASFFAFWKLEGTKSVVIGILLFGVGILLIRERLKTAQLHLYEEAREKEKEEIREQSRRKRGRGKKRKRRG